MITSIRRETQFKKDFKKIVRQGKDAAKLKDVITALVWGKPLPENNRDHKLSGTYSDCRECHIEPDWLLIYRIDLDEIVLIRTGSHSDLFK